MRKLALLLGLSLLVPSTTSATWSVIAVDKSTGRIVIASATCVNNNDQFLMGVQAVVVPGKGVAACQAGVDNTHKNQMLVFAELQKGTDPKRIIELLSEDPAFQSRQFGILDLQGRSAGHSGLSNGYVSQDIFLFSGSVRENLLLGVQNGEVGKVEEAARIARLLPAIESFSGGFETIIGERGVRLSGGQKQRAALARALIKNAPILILDDAFSSVDVETEEEILGELKQFMRGRTTLLISHRISTVCEADMIVYLRGGAIIEQGTHGELLAQRGAYYELYRRQSLEREVEIAAHAEVEP